ncbi:MAG: heavy-metal-associated domain-containing protein, partial [Chloroflexota bacterium]|nr:heavy-metal-associated domain-containing protein [Chloroflexota bacterium]
MSIEVEGKTNQEPRSAQQTFAVEGMTCASCVNRIERRLKKVDGVLEVNVNLATEKATVRYLPEKAGMDDFRQAV